MRQHQTSVAKATIDHHPAVLNRDLPNIYAFIARDNVEAANQLLNAIDSTFDLIAHQPECGVRYRPRHRKLADVCIFPVRGYSNYLVFYRIDGVKVRVLYVVHGVQNLMRLFRRDPR